MKTEKFVFEPGKLKQVIYHYGNYRVTWREISIDQVKNTYFQIEVYMKDISTSETFYRRASLIDYENVNSEMIERAVKIVNEI